MPAARLWRIVGIDTYGSGALELSALHLYDDAGRVDASALLTCSHVPSSGALAALQDTDPDTLCAFDTDPVRSPGFWLQWDFGTGSSPSINAVRVGAGATRAVFPSKFIVQYMDAYGWVTLPIFERNDFAVPFAIASGMAQVFDTRTQALLLYCDGPAGSAEFSDSSNYHHRAGNAGGVTIAPRGDVFGGAASFIGGAQWLQFGNHPMFEFGAGDFTIELQVKTTVTGRDLALVDYFQSLVGGWQVYLTTSGKLCFYENTPTAIVATGTSNVANGAWHHVAACRTAGVLRLFVDGVLEAHVANTKDHRTPGFPLGIGAQIGTRNANYDFVGMLDRVRILKGVGLYETAFTPPGALTFESPPITTRTQAAPVFTRPVGTLRTLAAQRQSLARDTAYGGDGTIRDTVELKATPSNAPLRRRVRLYSDRSGEKVRETWSEAATGIYEFPGIDTAQQFTALATDHERVHQAVAADNLTPKVLP